MAKQTLVTIGWLAIAILAAPVATVDARDSRTPPLPLQLAPTTPTVKAEMKQSERLAATRDEERPSAGAEVAPRRKVVLISRIKARAGRGTELESAIREFYRKVREAEPGCLVNVMHRPAPPPGRGESGGGFALSSAQADTFVFYEVYADAAAAAGHTKTPHFQALMARLDGVIDGKIELEFLDELDAK
jgi:quinol monooxygenase YgiN